MAGEILENKEHKYSSHTDEELYRMAEEITKVVDDAEARLEEIAQELRMRVALASTPLEAVA